MKKMSKEEYRQLLNSENMKNIESDRAIEDLCAKKHIELQNEIDKLHAYLAMMSRRSAKLKKVQIKLNNGKYLTINKSVRYNVN